jgi:phosphopantothenoylcysteine decarboxylase/phosphopantothenate--cysteine ligase
MHSLKNKKILITLGPTREYLDPVRFLSNTSSGQMGLALARQLKKLKAKPFLICGPGVDCHKEFPCVSVISAKDMLAEVLKRFKKCSIFISVAAVSDYCPKKVSRKKIKIDYPTLELKPNPDILYQVGKKKTKQISVGFSLEDTLNLKEAQKKMIQKNCDLMLLNTTATMGANYIQSVLLWKNHSPWFLGRLTKKECAKKICQAIQNCLQP